ncbi:uncharacterized proline-rich protein-like [Belonocnema kinseyi]|uniref:uncharacterized proline-rich protein-like n=1 Tax=Belonocnema kinseyi TaxID=2817044 RepID=UPI00143D066A|nr:uncharacterized proline-rich protein-like [Belonocnema kinseyi]
MAIYQKIAAKGPPPFSPPPPLPLPPPLSPSPFSPDPPPPTPSPKLPPLPLLPLHPLPPFLPKLEGRIFSIFTLEEVPVFCLTTFQRIYPLSVVWCTLSYDREFLPLEVPKVKKGKQIEKEPATVFEPCVLHI